MRIRTIVSLLLFSAIVGPSPASAGERISPREAASKIESGAVVLDVRSPEEFAEGHLPGALNIPHDQIQARANELEQFKDREIVLYCGSGRRAGIAIDKLEIHGFGKLYNAGGYKDLAGESE